MWLWMFTIMLLLSGFLAPIADAKIWYINDYQNKLLYKGRINQPQSSSEDGELNRQTSQKSSGCEANDFKSMDGLGADHVCTATYPVSNETCCSNWKYNTDNFPYTSCRSGLVPTGECADKNGTKHYRECKCNTTTYQYTTSNCAYAVSGTSCSDSSGTHYSGCYQNACEKASGENACKTNCEYGCNTKYSGCDSCCIECKSCSPKDCSAYPHSGSCPTGANCGTACQKGCGDTVNHYKVESCKAGYTASGNTCVACTWNNYTLTSCPSGFSCNSSTCGGSTKYSIKGCASGYASSCSSGYELTSTSTHSGYTCGLCKSCALVKGEYSSCPDKFSCESRICGSSTIYTIDGCATGYKSSCSSGYT